MPASATPAATGPARSEPSGEQKYKFQKPSGGQKLIKQGLISDNSKLVPRSNYLALDNSLYLKTTKNHFPTLKEMIKAELNNSF